MGTARNELYTGTFHGVEDYCPAYVSRSDWERIILGHEIVKKTQKVDRVYLFTGLIRCPDCGNTLKATFKTYPSDRTKEYNGYRCNNAKLRTCSFRHQLSERKVENYLLENIQAEMHSYILKVEVAEKKKQRKPNVQNLVKLNEQLRRLNVIYIAGNIADEEYVLETKRIKAAIEKAKKTDGQARPVNLEGLKTFLESNFLSIYDTLSKEDQQCIWRSIIDEIYVEGTTVTGVKFRD